ncbi:hypothetical protein [Aurantimonas sp. VKM B-3413]|uniref:hypothetical protein n=1 Tax=Aurantimonas sp. VKM B-3413 TaxID=2779401 RepID=UPI001E3BA4E1|nr:hypothetical protein [Aurantimonas sp. VKM B-3413]MCB8837241.1 hypothetical protein [Aurantimonas sp. VKM B-3413]
MVLPRTRRRHLDTGPGDTGQGAEAGGRAMLIYCIWRIGRIRRELRLWRFMRRQAGFGRMEALTLADQQAACAGQADDLLAEGMNFGPASGPGRSALARLEEARGAWSELGRTGRHGFIAAIAA